MGAVQDHLVAGVGVNGAHDAALNGGIVVQGLGHGGQAVGGAGSGGNDGVILRQGVFIYTEHDGGKIVARGSGNDDLLRAGVDVRLRFGFGAVEARALQHNVYADLAPGQILCVLFRIDLEGFAVHGNGAGLVVGGNGMKPLADPAAVTALGGIILQQMSKHGGLGQIVDSHDLIALCTEHLTEGQAADTAKTIDCNFYGHWENLLKM